MPLNSEDLEHVYGASSPEESRAVYDGWAGSYDADNLAKGFRLPGIGAAFAARYVPRNGEPLLDAGCGTGLVGESLAILGYQGLHGLDLSPGMLQAAARLGVYRELFEHPLGKPLPMAADSYGAVTCFGSFGPGHAPPESLEEFARVTRPGGHVIFNLVEASYAEQGFPEVIQALARSGRWRERERSAPFRAFLLAEPDIVVRVFAFEIL